MTPEQRAEAVKRMAKLPLPGILSALETVVTSKLTPMTVPTQNTSSIEFDAKALLADNQRLREQVAQLREALQLCIEAIDLNDTMSNQTRETAELYAIAKAHAALRTDTDLPQSPNLP